MLVALLWKQLVGLLFVYCPLPPLWFPLPPLPRLKALVWLRSIGTAVFCIQHGAFEELYWGELL